MNENDLGGDQPPGRFNDGYEGGGAETGFILIAVALAAVIGLGTALNGPGTKPAQVSENTSVQLPGPPMTSPTQIPEQSPSTPK
jgi:hypothetical protein